MALEPERTRQFFRYLVATGAEKRWGPDWASDPDRPLRIAYESQVIEDMGFCSYFLILERIMRWCRDERIVYGPGRGSVGGSLVAYTLQIHEMDSLEFNLSFERFLNPERVAYPDVDLDVSQRHRHRVLQFIRQEFEDKNTAVLQVAAFARAGARRTIDMVAAAKRETDPDAEGIAVNLKRLLPEGNNVTGGTKQAHEIAWWLENGNRRNREAFIGMATTAGWLELLLKLDGVFTHLTSHAAGVVIISRDDLTRLPQTGVKDSKSGEWRMMTGYDMYSLDDLKYLKIDILGLRTLDIVSDAHKFCGGTGGTPELMDLWRDQRDIDTKTYDLLCNADTTGVFQVETSGYRRTLKDFQPRTFDHIVQLNALYRPGALDSKRDDGKNMVEVFIDRLHGREPITYPDELRSVLPEILGSTQGIILYQEQAMKIARVLAGFTETEADNLRKAIGKKQRDRMEAIKPKFVQGMLDRGYSKHAAETQFGNIEAASRYSWNLSHCLVADTIIPTTKGIKTVSSICSGDRVVSYSSKGLCAQTVKRVFDNGIQPTLSVECDGGLEIRGTPNHRLLTEQGYKSLKQLVYGDCLQVISHFTPVPGVQVFAAIVTGMAEGDKIPGWVISYDNERNDVVYWQFVAAIRSVNEFGEPASLTPTTVSFSNPLFESVIPGNTCSQHKGSPVSDKVGSRPILRTRLLNRSETSTFFQRAQNRSQIILDSGAVKPQLLSNLWTRELIFQIEPLHLLEHSRADFGSSIPDQSQFSKEAGERGFATTKPKSFNNFRIHQAGGMEFANLIGTLPHLIGCLCGQSLAVAGDITSEASSNPFGITDQWLTTPAFTEFWNRIHVTIVPGLTPVRKIERSNKARVFDLEMPNDHNFVANGIVSHNSEFYGCITWWTAFFKANRHIDIPGLGLDGPGTAGFYAALINSLDEDKDRQADAVAEARQHVEIKPPEINVAEESYTIDGDAIVFGLNGIKGMGEANRLAIMVERMLCGPFKSFEDFHRRLPSVPINMKLSLVQCGAFDSMEGRERLLSVVPRLGAKGEPTFDKDGNPREWTVAEFIKHNCSLKKPRELPPITDWRLPTEKELGDGEMNTIGFYVSADPMADVNKALKRLDHSCHWGGEIVASTIKVKNDKRGQPMGWFTLLTNSLNKQRCMVFASNWDQCRPKVLAGGRVIVRGRIDGSQLIVDAIFPAGDYSHFKVIILSRNGDRTVDTFDGNYDTIEMAEASGYEVQLA